MPGPTRVVETLSSDEVVAIAAYQIRALNPLLRLIAWDKRFSKEDRALLRKLSGEGMFNERGIFELYRLATALTSETARRQVSQNTTT